MGLCPSYAQEGDRVYIVPGLHVPVDVTTRGKKEG